jgi:hypothetical protein
MAEINLTQEEANILIAMEKHRANEGSQRFSDAWTVADVAAPI